MKLFIDVLKYLIAYSLIIVLVVLIASVLALFSLQLFPPLGPENPSETTYGGQK